MIQGMIDGARKFFGSGAEDEKDEALATYQELHLRNTGYKMYRFAELSLNPGQIATINKDLGTNAGAMISEPVIFDIRSVSNVIAFHNLFIRDWVIKAKQHLRIVATPDQVNYFATHGVGREHLFNTPEEADFFQSVDTVATDLEKENLR